MVNLTAVAKAAGASGVSSSWPVPGVSPGLDGLTIVAQRLSADQPLVQGGTSVTRNPRAAALLGVLAGVLMTAAVAAPGVQAANRYASPAGSTSGACTLAPCTLGRAVETAVAGDVVLLAAGDYAVGAQLSSSATIEIRPELDASRPRLVGAAGMAYPTLALTGGGVVKGLQIENQSGKAALQLSGGSRGTGLLLFAGGTNAVAAKLVSDPARTALLNSVARTTSSYTAIEAVDPASPGVAGHVSVVNVTAVATGASSWGVTTDLAAQSPVLKNSIIRSTSKVLHGRSDTRPIVVSNSNYNFAQIANITDAGGNQNVAVPFVDEAGADYHVTAGSPTIDAGAADALLTGTTDPDGRARVVGSQPDIGAYEFGVAAVADPDVTPPPPPPADPDPEADPGARPQPDSGTGTPDADDRATDENPSDVATDTGAQPTTGLPLLPPAAPPVLAERVGIRTSSGRARVKMPGTGQWVPLSAAASIPVGSTIDATEGRVELTSVRDAKGTAQTGEFWGGVFVVRQTRAKKPYTELALTGGSFRSCPRRTPGRLVARAAGSGKMRGVVRKLWGKDKAGRFRTRGRRSVATVRGTVWLVADRCDGTLTRVKEGAVEVRDRRTGRKKLVEAGEKHLVRAPKRRAAPAT